VIYSRYFNDNFFLRYLFSSNSGFSNGLDMAAIAAVYELVTNDTVKTKDITSAIRNLFNG
jgi:hypothetical protein